MADPKNPFDGFETPEDIFSGFEEPVQQPKLEKSPKTGSNIGDQFLKGVTSSTRAIGKALGLSDQELANTLKTSGGRFGIITKPLGLQVEQASKVGEAGTTGEKIAEFVGGALDPAALAIGEGSLAVASKIPGVKNILGEAGTLAAKKVFNETGTAKAATALYKAQIKEVAAKAGVQGAALGGLSGLASTQGENLSAEDIAKRTIGGAAIGGGAGILFGGGIRAAAGKARLPELLPNTKATVNETPASQQLIDDIAKFSYDNELLSDRQLRLLDQQRELRFSPPQKPQFDVIEAKPFMDKLNSIQEQKSILTIAPDEALSNKLAQEEALTKAALDDVYKKQQEKLLTFRQERLQNLQLRKQTLQEIRETSTKMQENASQIAKLDKAREELQLNIPGVSNPDLKVSGFIAEAKDLALEQARRVIDLGKRGIIDEKQAKDLAQQEYNNALRVMGVLPDPNKVVVPISDKLNRVEAFNAKDRVTGTRLAEVAIKAGQAHDATINLSNDLTLEANQILDNLNKLGFDDESTTKLMQHIGREGFDPSALKVPGFTRSAWVGNGPSDEVIAEALKLREWYNQVYEKLPQDSAGFRDFYVPIKSKQGTTVSGSGLKSITDPKAAQARLSGVIDPTLHDTNMRSLVARSAREAIRTQEFAPVLKDAFNEIAKLKLDGDIKGLETFTNWMKQSLGLKDDRLVSEFIASDAFNFNKDVLNQLAQEVPEPEKFLSALNDEFKKSAYLSWVTVNPRGIIRNLLQPEVYGIAELGVNGWQLGRFGIASREERKVLEKLLKYAITEQLPELQAIGNITTNKNLLVKGLRLNNKLLEKTSGTLFNKAERLNRKTVILGAFRQAKQAIQLSGDEGLRSITDNMLQAEKNFIFKALKEQGSDAASEAYALLRDRRINFKYNKIDQPEILANKLGNKIPFLTFTRNVLSRYAGDIQEGNYSTLAKRIVGPAMGIWALQNMLGYSLKGVSPVEGLGGSTINIAPQLTQPIEQLGKGDFKAAAKSVYGATAPGAIQRQIKRIHAAKTPAEILGFEKTNQRTWFNKLWKDIVRE